jgi:hypothetical protein
MHGIISMQFYYALYENAHKQNLFSYYFSLLCFYFELAGLYKIIYANACKYINIFLLCLLFSHILNFKTMHCICMQNFVTFLCFYYACYLHIFRFNQNAFSMHAIIFSNKPLFLLIIWPQTHMKMNNNN